MEPDFESVLALEQQREQRQALKTLLQNPLLTANGKHAEAFVLVRRHEEALREWLSRNLNWSLYTDSETVRLSKVPVNLKDTSRGAKVGKQAFSRRRYALFCLALAALTQGERQTTLGRLFELILHLASADPELGAAGLLLDPTLRDHRRDLVGAVHLMLELGLLARIDGEESAFIGGKGDVLYTVNRSALAWVLNVRRSPSTVEERDFEQRLQAIVKEPAAENEDANRRRIRLFLNRKLLDDPVLYYEQLDDEERSYLQNQRNKIVRELELFTGLHPEIRREGIAMADESGQLTDLDMPAEGTEGHITLLVASFLANHLKEYGGLPIATQAIRSYLLDAAEIYGKYWRKDARSPEALASLQDEAIARLQALHLIRTDRDGIVALPALARYQLDEPIIHVPKTQQGELF